MLLLLLLYSQEGGHLCRAQDDRLFNDSLMNFLEFFFFFFFFFFLLYGRIIQISVIHTLVAVVCC